MHVMFYECYKEEETLISKLLPPGIEAEYNWRTIQESLHPKPPARLISIRTQSKFPLAWAGGVDGILSRSQGYDHLLELKASPEIKAALGSLAAYCSRSVAEHAVMLMLCLWRKFRRQVKNFDTFDRSDITGSECRGKNALVVGVGNIGREIVDIVKGLRMEVKGVDILPRGEIVELVTLDEGLRWADVIFCALPLTDATRGLLGYEALKGARPGAILINVSRGEITPAEDMRQLVTEGALGGLGLDVFPHERDLAVFLRKSRNVTDRSCRLLQELNTYDNVIFTPHNAFNTREALQRKVKLTVEAVGQFLKDKTFPFTVS